MAPTPVHGVFYRVMRTRPSDGVRVYLGLGMLHRVCRGGVQAYVRMCGSEALYHVGVADLEIVEA